MNTLVLHEIANTASTLVRSNGSVPRSNLHGMVKSSSYEEARQLGLFVVDLVNLFVPHPLFTELRRQLIPVELRAFKPGSLSFYADGSPLEAVLASPRRIHGIIFPVGTKLVFHKDGSVGWAYPSKQLKIMNMPAEEEGQISFYPDGRVSGFQLAEIVYDGTIGLEPGYVYFHPNGAIKEARLAHRRRFGHVMVPAGSDITLDTSRRLVRLGSSANVIVDSIGYSHGGEMHFHPNGRVKRGMLLGDQRIRIHKLVDQKIPCKGGSFVAFDDKGNLMGANLVHPVTIQGIACAKQPSWVSKPTYDVVFHNNGKVYMARLAHDQSFDGIECKGDGERLWLYPDGKLMLGTLAKPTWIKTGTGYYVEGHQGDEITLFENGTLAAIRVTERRSIGGKLSCKNSIVRLYRSGTIKEFTPPEDVIIKGVPCAKGTETLLHPNGRVRCAELAWGHAFKDIVLPRGSYVWLDDVGKPEAVELFSPALIKGTFYPKGTLLDLRKMKVLRVQR